MKVLILATVLLVGYSHCLPSIFHTKRECGLSESKSLFDQSIDGPKKQNLAFMIEFSRFMNHKAPELLQEFSLKRKVSDAREKLRRRQYQSEFRAAIRKLEAIREYSDRQKRAFDIEGRQDEVVDAGEDVVDDTADTDGDVADILPEIVDDTADAVVDVVDDVTDVVDDTADAVVDTAGDVADVVSDVVDDVVEGGGEVVDGAVDVVEDTVEVAEDLADSAGELVGDIIGVVTNSTTDVIDIFTEVVESVGTALEENLPPSVWNAMCVVTWWPLEESHCNAARCVACAPSITTAASVCGQTKQAITHKCLEEVMGEGFCNFCIKEYL